MAKSRIFFVMQYEKHPETGEELLSESQIKVALAHKTIHRWAYILHDKDVYSAQDELDNPNHKQGQKKGRHWHIAIEMGSNQAEISTIAKWFGIKENYVEIAKGAGAFLDCVEYLTHEAERQQELYGKVMYDDSDVTANFEWRAALDKRAENRAKYGRDMTDKERMRMEVRENGRSLLWCYNNNALLYMEDMDKLKKLRIEYINRMEPPRTRLNYYVEGRGGVGKGLMCRALARSMYPDMPDDEVFFEVGAKGAPFEGYDGQPVIIWNDRRAYDLLVELNGRGNVFNVFDTHPTRQRQNVKYSSINLCNAVNIVNSVQSYSEFLDGLAGEYKDNSGDTHEVEDKGQSYRRFPFIIPIHESDFDLLINKGFYEGTDKFQDYIEYKHIRGNMQRIVEACQTNETLARMIQAKTVQPVIDKHKEVLALQSGKDMTDDQRQQVLAEFKDYGTIDDNEDKKEGVI